MPRLRKLAISGTVVFVTTSVEAGVVFPCNPLIELILKHCLARAQALHPGIKISHLGVEGTHIHFLATIIVPSDLRGFMERFKTESAHAINKLLGRKKHTIWCEGYDSPVLCTKEDVIKKIVYLYTNPSKDGLENSISDYPGFSTWRMWQSGSHHAEAPQLRRYHIKALNKGESFAKEGAKRVQQLWRRVREKHSVTISPNAWMESFGIDDPQEQEAVNNEILSRISEQEDLYRKQREQEGKRVRGAARLKAAPIDTSYLPERSGRRMICHSCDRQARKNFIARAKLLFQQAREAYEAWKQGLYVPFPPGLYPPSFPRLAELVPKAFFAC